MVRGKGLAPRQRVLVKARVVAGDGMELGGLGEAVSPTYLGEV